MSSLENASRQILLEEVNRLRNKLNDIKLSSEFKKDKELTKAANKMEAVIGEIQDKLGGSSKIATTATVATARPPAVTFGKLGSGIQHFSSGPIGNVGLGKHPQPSSSGTQSQPLNLSAKPDPPNPNPIVLCPSCGQPTSTKDLKLYKS